MEGSETVAHIRRVALPLAVVAALVAGCSTHASSDDTEAPTSVPTSTHVAPPHGPATRTAPGTVLTFGQSAVLPANAFATSGPLAMYTVTGITAAQGVPADISRDGAPYFVYVTVTALAPHPEPAPGLVGLAGSADARTAALTLPPPPGLPKCPPAYPPKRMSRGESYSACLIAVTDKGKTKRLHTVIYWADTATGPDVDYKHAPVVWTKPGPPSPGAVGPAPPPAPPAAVTPSAG